MLSTTQPAGVWDFVQDSGAASTLWSSLTLESELNSGDVFVEVRAADSITELTSWPFQRLVGANGTIPLQSPSIKGRYIEVRVNLLREFGQANGPVLKNLVVVPGHAGGAFSITRHPESQIISQGSSATFQVQATGTGLAYQWFKLGQANSVGSASSLTATQPGEYFCRVADASGVSLESSHAQLHVRSSVNFSMPLVPQWVYNTEVVEVQIETAPGEAPLYYQWRKDGIPIPGAHGIPQPVQNTTNTYSVTREIPAGNCSDLANYSVVFTNQFWKVVQGDIGVTPATGQWLILTESTSGTTTTLTATACFTPEGVGGVRPYIFDPAALGFIRYPSPFFPRHAAFSQPLDLSWVRLCSTLQYLPGLSACRWPVCF